MAEGPGRRPRHSRATGSALDEREQVGVDHVGVHRAHAVREFLIDLESALLQELHRQQRGVGDRHDLVVVTVHDERGDVDHLQVLGEVGLREGLDAVVMRLRTAHHPLAPPILDHALGHLCTWTVVAVERTACEIKVELRAIGGELLAQTVEHLDRQTARIGWCLYHDRRHGTDEHQLGDAALAVAGDIAGRLAAAGGVANVDGVAQVEMLDDVGGVGGVVVHVVAAADLARPAMAAPVMGDDAVALLDEVEHLRVPVVTAQRPAVMKNDRLTGAPVLVIDLRSVFGRDCSHGMPSFALFGRFGNVCLLSRCCHC